MSTPHFAPITSNLLARKGDAAPSAIAGRPTMFWRREPEQSTIQPFVSESLPRVAALSNAEPEPASDTPRPFVVTPLPETPPRPLVAKPESAPRRVVTAPAPEVAAAAALPATDGKLHKIMVALTPVEFEKLGIAAVKKGVTRHHIVRTALDMHLDRLKREYGGCGCMANGGQCLNDCDTE